MPYNRIPNKFAYSGMDIHHPPDLMPPGKCSLLFNMYPDLQNGTMVMRPALDQLATTVSGVPIHSISRLNDSFTSSFTRFVGSGSVLYSGSGGTLASLDTGFSGNPLAMVPYRPPQSPQSWMYVYDSSRQQRYKADNSTKQNIGIAAPTLEPSAVRIQPLYDTVDNATATWSSSSAVGGSITGPSTVARVPSSAFASVILYDVGSTGMICVLPSATNYEWMTAGSMVVIGSETVVIEQVFPSTYSTTVGAIQYDTGSTGLCTIVPAVPLPGLARNMLLYLNSTVYVRVLNVTAGPDGSYSFRCNTASTTVAAGQTIVAGPNFRCWVNSTHIGGGGSPLTGNSINFTFTPSPSNGTMSGILSATPGTGNLSFAGSRPLLNEDYMHVSVAFDAPQYVTEIHVMLDVDETTNDFNHNYYYYVLRQGDFQQSVIGGNTTLGDQLSAITASIQSQLASEESFDTSNPQPPYPAPQVPSAASPSPEQIQVGGTQWLEAMFKLENLTRVGSDASRTLANVAKVGFAVFTSGGTANVYFGGWWAGGGYGPDCDFNSYGNQFAEIQWRYQYYNSLTGAKSTVSPETRNGEILRRQGINITANNSPDAQVDTILFERRGGTNPDWHYVGSMPVGGGGVTTFLDNVTEAAAQIGTPLEVTSYQPWPVTDVPRTGTASVVGTSVVYVSGDHFNVRWLRGTEIIIGGNTYSLYAPPSSTTVLQLAQNIPPPSGNFTWSIPEATIEGQPLYGAWLDESNNRIMAVGDPLNPGILYFSNVNNPDGASDSGYIEVTPPSEPLLNGFYDEGANYVFSNSGLYRVDSTPGSANPYVAHKLTGVEGMAGPWAFDHKRRNLYWWGPDGIYGYQFGAAGEMLTQDLYPLFPHAGQHGQQGIPGVPVSIAGNTIYPPNYANASFLRIGYSESFVYATYQNTNTVFEALVYSLEAKGWRKDQYTPNVALFWLEEGVANPLLLVGGTDGDLYNVSSTATADHGGAVSWLVLPPVQNAGDSRALKQWGDLWIDYSAANTVGIQVLWDNLLVTGINPSAASATNRTQTILDLVSAPQTTDILHLNVTMLFTGTGPVFLYEWQPSYLPLPEDSEGRPTDWQIGASKGFKWINGVIIHADTFNVAKSLKVEYDNQTSGGAVITVTHNGEQRIPYYFPPIYAHELRLVPQDDVLWHDWQDEEWIGNNEPEYGGAVAVNWIFGGQGFKWINGVMLHADTFNQPKLIEIQLDGGATSFNITIQHNGEETLPYYFAPVYGHQLRIVPQDNVAWRCWPDVGAIGNDEPEYGGALAVNWTNGGLEGYKWINGLLLHADTFNTAKQIQLQFDGGIIGPTITINHNGEETLPYYFTPYFYHLYRIVPLDSVPWRHWKDTRPIGNTEPEYGGALAVNWVFGGSDNKWVNGILIHADTFNKPKLINIQMDGGATANFNITIQHNGEETLPYYFTPVYGHQLRIIPADSVSWRFWPDLRPLGNTEPEAGGALAVNWSNGGAEGNKWVNGILLHADSFNKVKQIQLQFDGGTNPVTLSIQHNGEETLPYYFAPVYAHMYRIVPLDGVPWRFWQDTVLLFNLEPEYGGALAVNWVNGGTEHYKYVQGIRLHADTFGLPKQVQIQYDGGIIGPTLTILHNGEETLPYSWPVPFKAHLMRIVPLDNVPWRYWNNTEWVYEIEPEVANYWISQPTALGQNGYIHARELWIAYTLSGASGVISAIVDGKLTTIATVGQSMTPVKKYFPCPPVKGQYWQLTATGSGLQIYERDCEFLVKSWGSTASYMRVKPFGDISGGGGASGSKI